MHKEKFDKLVKIMRKLRNECSWDKVQTFDSIKASTLEETYEVIEAIDERDYEDLKNELGDLLLHILFHSVIAEDQNLFSINEVIDSKPVNIFEIVAVGFISEIGEENKIEKL